jgi:cytidylate kinase
MAFTVAIDGPAAAGKGTIARATAPLKPAEDAVMIDTSDMSIEQAFVAAIAAISQRMP